MSIAQKLITIADNTPKVAAAVNAKKPGKNLVDYKKAVGRTAAQMAFIEITNEGVLWKAGGDYYFEIPVTLSANTTFVCSASGLNGAGEALASWSLLYEDNTYNITRGIGVAITPEKNVKALRIYKLSPVSPLTQDLLVTNIQLEYGTAVTPYEPYKDPVLYQQALEKAGQIKTALIELGGSPIFDGHGFGESILNEIITKQADILAKQDSYIGTISEVSIGVSGSNINDILNNVISAQELILTAQNNYIGGDAE